MVVIRKDITTPASVSNEYSPGVKGFLEKVHSLVNGLGITARISTEKPITIRYPAEKWTVSPRWRGALRLRGVLGHDEIPLIRDASTAYNAVIDDLYNGERLPPCVGNCPANVDARGQGFLIAEDRIPEAYELVRDRNILPGVLGRICHHPCETACRRNFYDEPVAIRPLHRFAYEEFRKVASERLRPLPITQEKSVAIVGSGPSGLTAAYDLMKAGYRCVMYEREERPGGALNSGVPAYRLPRDVLYDEIDGIVALGLELHCGIEVGKGKPLGALQREHDAVLLAVGLQTSRILPIPGADADGVVGALEFLWAANHKGETGVRGKRVFVIGGGNVAVDVARCALRTGASEVRLASLESEEEMPAHPWEIEEALDEGVIATCSVGPEEVLVKHGAVTGMRMRECLSVFDETGRFSPKYGEGLSDFPCDVVVFSIGQAARLDTLIAGTEVLVSGRGQLVVDGSQFTTSTPGVFACGEVVTGPGSAIGSIATGHEAATSIIRFLQGAPLSENRTPRPVPVYAKYAVADVSSVERSRLRSVMPMTKPEERAKDFRQVELGLTHQEAMMEAARCLRCQSEVCVGCTFCARTCPDYAIHVERVDDPGGRCLTRYDLDLSKCAFCGLCAEQCPTNALTHTGQYELSFFHRDLMIFDKGEMLRSGDGTRATGRDGIMPPGCPVPRWRER
ncbi:MAG: FAD-dependent oxidoreductase [Actinomycetota bacterium]|nr:FAD-dependent oxidoreductase [Actinomycetota bacterium]MDP3629903.1 FAD-dependent oxidoreductase [Actinomycetota bacterium]